MSHDVPPKWLQAKHGGTTRSKVHDHIANSDVEDEIWFLGDEAQDNALAIVDGVRAWKRLTNGKGPLWRRFNREELERRQSHESTELRANAHLPSGHPAISPSVSENSKCPFASMANLRQQPDAPQSQQPDSLPTPPHTQEHLEHQPALQGNSDGSISPSHSITGSVSKCPIRMLDERSPEEIAEYFEHHKHEIPRSHEICVKRFQSNTESIRQLDAKYGNLVNMIQGLGMKHQPLLPAKGDELDTSEVDAKSIKKVESWADNVKENPEEVDLHSALLANPSDTDVREGHFDRPLKEVRVGESPSRPWGISVPGATANPDIAESEAAPTPREPETRRRRGSIEQVAIPLKDHGGGGQHDDKQQMVFTGPVFIGYSAEQAASLIEKCGWDPQGPPC